MKVKHKYRRVRNVNIVAVLRSCKISAVTDVYVKRVAEGGGSYGEALSVQVCCLVLDVTSTRRGQLLQYHYTTQSISRVKFWWMSSLTFYLFTHIIMNLFCYLKRKKEKKAILM